jgi:hypothetical protein
MKDLETIISGLEFKIRNLINLHKNLKTENENLLKEKNELLKNLNLQNEKIKELDNKYKILKISKTIESGQKGTDIKLKINEMVREIDKCVEILNK